VGKSAYDIAVENGFIGTEREWLSTLKNADAYLINVPVTGWSADTPHRTTLPVAGINAGDQLFWDVYLDTSESAEDVERFIKSYNLIDKIEAGSNTITLYCWSGVPVVPIVLRVVVVHATET
jgi:hypothetical protein